MVSTMAKTTSGKVSARTAPSKTPTKKRELIRMLRVKSGGDIATLSAALGWQPHTVRAAITGLRKAGHVVVATKPGSGGASRYRIVSGAGKGKVETPEPTPAEGSEAVNTDESAEPSDAR